MTLVKKAKFALDDKVGQYIPSWNANGKQNVTIRAELLAHTSRIVDGSILGLLHNGNFRAGR